MFLITGITGHVGGSAARHLLAEGKQVRALVRDLQKAAKWADQGVELVKGDWTDVAALASALTGVEGAYLMMPPTQTPSRGFPEAKALAAGYAEALRQSPPPRLVVLSSFGSEKDSGLGLITATRLFEQALDDVTFPLAAVRAGTFYENYLYGLQAAQGGMLPLFNAPTDRKIPAIASEDIGTEVAKLLVGASRTGKRVIELGSYVSPDELAAQLGEVLGRDVKGAGRSPRGVVRYAHTHGSASRVNVGLRRDDGRRELRLDRLRCAGCRACGRHNEREAGVCGCQAKSVMVGRRLTQT